MRRATTRRTLSVMALAVTACVAVSCVPRPRPVPPAPTTTAAPTTTSTTTPVTACQAAMSAALAAFNAGTYTSPALSIDIDQPAALDNPVDHISTGTPAPVTVSFVAHDADGAAITPSPTRPVTVTIYGAGTTFGSVSPTPADPSADPLTLEVTSGSSFSFTYDGGYLPGPVTIQMSTPTATTNPCTNTASVAIGAALVPLANAPQAAGTAADSLEVSCDSGISGNACATANITTDGVRVRASGDASGTGALHDFTIDTGSIGTALPVGELGPDAVGPGAPAYKYYDSSGNEYVGYLYLAPVRLSTGTGTSVRTDPIRLLAVVSSGCAPGGSCTTPPDPATFHYLGVGFDRNDPSPAAPLSSPLDNALLRVAPPVTGERAPGYVLGGGSVQVGVTAADVAGTTPAALTASPTVPGDWLTAPGSVSITPHGGTPTPVPATILMDTGIPEMFITNATGLLPEGVPADRTISVAVGTNPPGEALSYSFDSGPEGWKSPPAVGQAPSYVDHLHGASGVFVNTGRHVLFGADLVFDARHGAVSYVPLGTPLR